VFCSIQAFPYIKSDKVSGHYTGNGELNLYIHDFQFKYYLIKISLIKNKKNDKSHVSYDYNLILFINSEILIL